MGQIIRCIAVLNALNVKKEFECNCHNLQKYGCKPWISPSGKTYLQKYGCKPWISPSGKTYLQKAQHKREVQNPSGSFHENNNIIILPYYW